MLSSLPWLSTSVYAAGVRVSTMVDGPGARKWQSALAEEAMMVTGPVRVNFIADEQVIRQADGTVGCETTVTFERDDLDWLSNMSSAGWLVVARDLPWWRRLLAKLLGRDTVDVYEVEVEVDE